MFQAYTINAYMATMARKGWNVWTDLFSGLPYSHELAAFVAIGLVVLLAWLAKKVLEYGPSM